MHWLSLLASLHPFSWSRVMGQRHTSVLPFPEPHLYLQALIFSLSLISDTSALPQILRLSPLSSEPLITFQPCLLPAQPELWPASLRHSHTLSQASHFSCSFSALCSACLGLSVGQLSVCQIPCSCLTDSWVSFLFTLGLQGLGTNHFQELAL